MDTSLYQEYILSIGVTGRVFCEIYFTSLPEYQVIRRLAKTSRVLVSSNSIRVLNTRIFEIVEQSVVILLGRVIQAKEFNCLYKKLYFSWLGVGIYFIYLQFFSFISRAKLSNFLFKISVLSRF